MRALRDKFFGNRTMQVYGQRFLLNDSAGGKHTFAVNADMATLPMEKVPPFDAALNSRQNTTDTTARERRLAQRAKNDRRKLVRQLKVPKLVRAAGKELVFTKVELAMMSKVYYDITEAMLTLDYGGGAV